VVHLAVLATHPVVRAPDHAGPAADHAVDRSGPDWLAELDVPGWAGTGWSGTADRADQGPGRAEPGADHAPDRRRTTVPDQSADEAALAADLRRWAADQPDRPSRNAVMGRYGIDTTRANRLLDGLPPPDAGPHRTTPYRSRRVLTGGHTNTSPQTGFQPGLGVLRDHGFSVSMQVNPLTGLLTGPSAHTGAL